MSAEALDTIAALREVFGFVVFFIAPVMMAFWVFGRLFESDRSSW